MAEQGLLVKLRKKRAAKITRGLLPTCEGRLRELELLAQRKGPGDTTLHPSGT